MDDTELCPCCGEGRASLHVCHQGAWPMYYRLCDTCGSEYAGASEVDLTRKSKMKFPYFPTITILAYRPNVLHTSLGTVDESIDSDFKFFSFLGHDREGITMRLKEIILDDMQTRRQTTARHPFHTIIMLADGKLPEGDLKHDLDSLLRRCIEETTEALAEIERQEKLAKLQAERERQARLDAFQEERDFAQLRAVMSKYSREKLIAAGILPE